MPTTTVDLGRITVRQTQAPSTSTSSSSSSLPLALSLSTSCAIDLPSTWERSPGKDTNTKTQAYDIARACKEGTLWIAKPGSCQLNFSARPLSDNISDRTGARGEIIDELTLAMICGMVGDCLVWQEIGLQLRDRHCSPSSTANNNEYDDSTTDEKDTNVLTSSSASALYFLHHPDLSSDIHAPPSAPCAKFRGLSCKIFLSFVGDDLVRPESGRRPRKQRNDATHVDTPITVKTTRKRSPERGVEKSAKNVAENHGYNLRRGPRLGSGADVEDGIEGEETSSNGVPYTPAIEEQSGGDSIAHHVDIVDEVGELLDAALRELIGVGRRGSKGVRVVRQGGMPSLVEIAPAVWNQRYLQLVAAHAKLIPSIATSIARLGNSRSLRLRKKMKTITAAKDGPQHDVSYEVTERLWKLCQTGIRASPFLRGNGSRRGLLGSKMVPDEPAGGQHSLEYERAQTMMLPQYWGEYSGHMLLPEMGFYGDYMGGDMQMELLQDGLDRTREDGDDTGYGSGSGSEAWQAEWLAPHDVEMSEYEYDDDDLSKDLSNGDYDSEIYDSEIDGYEGEGFQSNETDDEIYDRDEEYEEEQEDDYEEDEDSVGGYFYADGYGNVFPVVLGDSNEGEEGDSHRSGESK